jgi:S-formylglutathione hydrolase FrmB
MLALALLIPPARASGPWCFPGDLDRINRHLHGVVVDHTHNHGADRRIWSPALGGPRDLYVYLPPGFQPCHAYPLVIWLHGFAQDEQAFLLEVVRPLDQAIAAGQLPPCIIAAPDGSPTGSPCFLPGGSFFLNSKAGRFEDFIVQDVWNFVVTHYPIRPEREAHVLAGVSMGGGSAYNLGIKYRDRFKVVVGIFPPLNSRWVDCHCRYFGNFDPNCWGWRTEFPPNEVIGRFYGVVAVRMKRLADPVFGRGPDVLDAVSQENPIEMIDRLNLQEGELAMYIGYGGKDQFNIDAQVESFLYRAHERGLSVSVGYVPNGKHDLSTAFKLLPDVLAWLTDQLAPYAP